MNGRFPRRAAAPMIWHLQHFLCGERAQQVNRIHSVGSFLPFAAVAHRKIL
jgi:hypothetical protein